LVPRGVDGPRLGHLFDHLLDDVPVFVPRVRGVHLDVVVAAHRRELDLDLPLALLDLPRLALHLDLLNPRAEDLSEHRERERLLPRAADAVEEQVRAVAVRDEALQVLRGRDVRVRELVERVRAMLVHPQHRDRFTFFACLLTL
jgi:hypothetical protein